MELFVFKTKMFITEAEHGFQIKKLSIKSNDANGGLFVSEFPGGSAA